MSKDKRKQKELAEMKAMEEKILASIDKRYKAEEEKKAAMTKERVSRLMKVSVPEKRTLKNLLLQKSEEELKNIAYNVGIDVDSENISHDELIEILPEKIVEFAQFWFGSILDEQLQTLQILSKEPKHISTALRHDEFRLDLLASLGLVSFGEYKNKLACWLPDEIFNEFSIVNHASFEKMVNNNTDVLRLIAGFLFFVGVCDVQTLRKKINQLNDEPLNETDFMRLLLNGSAWVNTVNLSEDGKLVFSPYVENPQELFEIQKTRDYDFAAFDYAALYEAGDEHFIDSTPFYKNLAQYLMKILKLDVLDAADVTNHIALLFQNGYSLKDVFDALNQQFAPLDEFHEQLTNLLIAFHQNLKLWSLKGHTIQEVLAKN